MDPPPHVFPASDSPIGNIASLEDKVAVITGASSGLGRAMALAYAAAGAYVVSADLKPTPPVAPTIAGRLKDTDLTTPTVDLVNTKWPAPSKDRASFVQCDVTNEESVKAAVAFAVQKYGRLDIMVNNAGISAETGSKEYSGAFPRIHETPVAALDLTYQVNIKGVWLGTKYAVTQMLAQEPHPRHSRPAGPLGTTTSDVHRGWIINISSIMGSIAMPGTSPYCASKSAVLGLTRAVGLEYAKDGIHVNAIQPGFADTALLENMYSKNDRDSMDATMKMLHPWGRTGRAEDIARAAVFLAGEGASWMTGQSIVVDGGYLAQ
ncbi:hypothetical protein Z517_07779 [Fonsecaea pedrosoi CBS 271.37]|uniref:NAD(P)-binding protein n=1 Tax=Fonsecaea pedrosoi CBS 271.37 TaxID=1442368 RepID=A0A0D2DJZ0_9EURO|nr:uncharacterized protein Z517_07779 [Fonsecaea pedrosoi CBS 271.37]KIW77946.1 hypothetical protein Z517_07779 [Fonsecaea pedrosoi CBS 271.37]